MDGSKPFSASVHTDRECGGRSRATFRVGNAARRAAVCGVFEGFIDKTPSVVLHEEGVTGRHGFAMLQLHTNEDEVGCEYDAPRCGPRATGGCIPCRRAVAVPLAPNIAYQGFLRASGAAGGLNPLFTSFRGDARRRLLGQPRVLDVRGSRRSHRRRRRFEGPFRLEIRGVGARRGRRARVGAVRL